MEEWEVWDVAVEKTAVKGETSSKEHELSNYQEASITSSVNESSVRDEEKFERSTRVSVRSGLHDSTQDLTTASSTRNSTPTKALEDSLQEEAKVTYVFKEQGTKSKNSLLIQSSDNLSPSTKPTKSPLHQSLRERLSLSFGSKNDNNKNKSKTQELDNIDTTKKKEIGLHEISSYKHSPSRSSFRRSLRERLSVNFGNDENNDISKNDISKNDIRKNKSITKKQLSKDTIKKINDNPHKNKSLLVEKNNSTLAKTFDHSPSKPKKSSRQSLRERLSLNFVNDNNDNNTNKNTNSLQENKSKDTIIKNTEKPRVNNSLPVESSNTKEENNQPKMLSRSKLVDSLHNKRDDDDEVRFPFEQQTNEKGKDRRDSGSVGQTKRHFSATRSDLTSVGLNSDDDEECGLNVFTDSDEILNLPSPISSNIIAPQQNSSTPKKPINQSQEYTDIKDKDISSNIIAPQQNSSTPKKPINQSQSYTDIKDKNISSKTIAPQQNSSTPKKPINRSQSYTDIKDKDNSNTSNVGRNNSTSSLNKSRTKTGEEIFLLSVPNLSNSHNKSKSLENIHRTGKKDSLTPTTSTSSRHSPVLRRSAKARTYSDSFRIDSGYFSPDDLTTRRDSAASSTSNLDNVTSTGTPYTITFTPEKSVNDTEENKSTSSNNSTKTPKAKSSSSIKQGLASVIPIGVGETMIDETNASNIIHNAESAHSVEEHGTFNLSVNKSREDEPRLSFTEEEEYVDIDYVIEEEDPTLDSCEDAHIEHNDIKKERENGDNNTNKDQEIKDTSNPISSLGNPEEYRQFVEELHNNDNKKQPRHSGSDDADCPKYRNKTPPLLTINIQSTSIDESETETSLAPVLDESKDEENEEFKIMHSTYPEINGDGGEPSFEGVDDALAGSCTSSPERYRTTSNNECNSPFEDSMKSFEAHEREYASCSNGSIPNGTNNAELTDEEDELAEWDNLGDSRRMTFVLLDYLPAIVEEDKTPAATGANCKYIFFNQCHF